MTEARHCADADLIVPVVLCGGSGTRLWPLSREAFPKQYLALRSERTLFQETLGRVGDRLRFGRPLVIANNEHRFIAAEQMRSFGIGDAVLIVEPIGRNTAPAAAVAAIHAQERDPDALILLMPADHVIETSNVLLDAISAGIPAARLGRIVLFGITPQAPITGYGYVKTGKALAGCALEVEMFVEKPDQATAGRYFASGSYLWNSGIFLASARHLLAELDRHVPGVTAAARSALEHGERDLDFLRLDYDDFSRAPSISLDHAVMERTDAAAIIPVSCDWSDLGAWSALWNLGPHDENGNVTTGDVVVEQAGNCYLRTDGPLVAAVGVEGVVVIATDDVVLVANKHHDQNVKRLVERLKQEKRDAAFTSRRVHRPWGFYESIQQGHRYQVKRITVNPGAKLSLQKHFHRAEHWVVVNGTALVTRDKETIIVRENESIYLPLGAVHRLENPGKVTLNLIEVQSGSYLAEDDIVRIEDEYQRT
jgi:mannose-1-phosphate guanylyltransferase/mannose-1-phosphate guanylyltransferase/mannose-6-phosphate isomerase